MMAQLHNHSNFSLLDGLGVIKDIMWTAYNKGNAGHAISDHGTCAGAFETLKIGEEIRKETGSDFKSVAGVEAYMIDDRFFRPRKVTEIREDLALMNSAGALTTAQIKEYVDKTTKEERRYWHLTLLAKSETGLANLFRMQYQANLEGCLSSFGRQRPQIDWNLLERYHEGLICLTACVRGPIAERVLEKDLDGAAINARRLHAIFGEDLYLEIMPLSINMQLKANYGCLDIADGLKLPSVASNDCHWLTQEDGATHEVLCAVQSKSKMSEPVREEGGKRFCLQDKNHYIKNYDEMYDAFREHHWEYTGKSFARGLLDRTMEVLDKCTLTMPKSSVRLPEYKIPDDEEFKRWQAAR